MPAEQQNSQLMTAAERKLVDEFLPAIAKVPLDNRSRRQWRSAPDIAGRLAAAVIRLVRADKTANLDRIAAGLGMCRTALNHFIGGKNTSNERWPEIVGVMQRAGVEPRPRGRDSNRAGAPATPPATVVTPRAAAAGTPPPWRFVNENDIEITETRTLRYGTPEYAAVLRTILSPPAGATPRP